MTEQLKPADATQDKGGEQMSEVTELARKFISRGKVAALDHPQTAIAHIKGLCEFIESLNTRAPAKPDAELVEFLTEIYNSGYNAGHHDTVESCYTQVLPVDQKTYHREIVEEFVQDMNAALTAQPGKEAANKIAKRLPIWMLDTYDKDSFSSMLSAVSYLKQQVSNQSDHNT